MKKGITLFLAAIFILVIACVQSFPGTEEKDFNPKLSVVQIFTTYQQPNYYIPWQMQPHGSRSGSGCIILGNRIITNAHVVSNQTFIQVRKAGEVDRFVAEVEYIAHDCDLALLTVTDPSFFTNTQSVELGVLPNLRETVSVYGFPIGGNQLAVTEGVVSRIECSRYYHNNWYLLTLQIDARVASGNSGGPVFSGDKLVGIAFQGGSTDEAIPVTIINHFLKDIADQKYDGFPDLGITHQKLESLSMRKKLRMKADQTGIYVKSVAYNTSAWSYLERGDVILSVDGIPIANDGTLPFMEDRVEWTHIVDLHYLGETVRLGVLRQGEQINVKIPLISPYRFVPLTEFEQSPSYYVYAGLIFIPLNQNYIDIWRSWDDVPTRLLHYFFYQKASVDRLEAVILTNVLAHDVNVGYQDTRNHILTHVNGIVIRDMQHLKTLLENNSEQFATFDFEGGIQIVIEPEAAKKALPDILKRYQVKAHCSDDLK